jgi:hypothetical protein
LGVEIEISIEITSRQIETPRLINRASEGLKSLSGSCPKMNIADKETIAYASKKMTPKLSKTLPAKNLSPSVTSTAR